MWFVESSSFGMEKMSFHLNPFVISNFFESFVYLKLFYNYMHI